MLLILPGILTDGVALLLLLLPINQRGGFGPQPVTAGRAPYRRDRSTRRRLSPARLETAAMIRFQPFIRSISVGCCLPARW